VDTLRSDAARNRSRILDAARDFVARNEPLALNAVARAADVGVATVYRHFTTVEELEETLVWERFDDLADLLDGAGPAHLERVLKATFKLLAEDALFEKVTSRHQPALEQTAALLTALIDRLGVLLDRVRAEGALREKIDAAGVLTLICGVAHAVRNANLPAESPQSQLLLRVVLDGLRGQSTKAALS
jgi:AcrR family transcriptional regulator